jgi:hypothetical protein
MMNIIHDDTHLPAICLGRFITVNIGKDIFSRKDQVTV